jgi:hypothetical protein
VVGKGKKTLLGTGDTKYNKGAVRPSLLLRLFIVLRHVTDVRLDLTWLAREEPTAGYSMGIEGYVRNRREHGRGRGRGHRKRASYLVQRGRMAWSGWSSNMKGRMNGYNWYRVPP